MCPPRVFSRDRWKVDFLGGPVIRIPSASQCRGHGFNPWSRKTPHATQQPSPRAAASKPMLHNC